MPLMLHTTHGSNILQITRHCVAITNQIMINCNNVRIDWRLTFKNIKVTYSITCYKKHLYDAFYALYPAYELINFDALIMFVFKVFSSVEVLIIFISNLNNL